MGVFLLAVVVIALAMLGMAVGAIFTNRCLRGSCGGPEMLDKSGDALNCDACPHRSTAPSHQAPAGPHRTRARTE